MAKLGQAVAVGTNELPAAIIVAAKRAVVIDEKLALICNERVAVVETVMAAWSLKATKRMRRRMICS